MKIYLDDVRSPPDGFTLVRSVKECINLLRNNKVKIISLDHDLGCNSTGYNVILWIERQVMESNYIPPKIRVHSANISARLKMEAGINQINKILKGE